LVLEKAINVRNLNLSGAADYKGPVALRLHNKVDTEQLITGIDATKLSREPIAMNDSLAERGAAPSIRINDLGNALDITLTGNEKPGLKTGIDRRAEIYLPYDPTTHQVEPSMIQGTVTELKQFGKDVIEATYSISTEGIKKLMAIVTESYYKLMDTSRLKDTQLGITKLSWDTTIAPVLTNVINKLGLKTPLLPRLTEDLRKYFSVTLCGGAQGPCPESPESVY
jgi:hypothetical protein